MPQRLCAGRRFGILISPSQNLPPRAGNYDAVPATCSQGEAVGISASDGKGAFPASDRCGHSGKKNTAPGGYLLRSEEPVVRTHTFNAFLSRVSSGASCPPWRVPIFDHR